MSRFVVDLPRLDELVGELAAASEQLMAAREAVDAEIAGLHGGWRGSAATAQAAAHRRWSAGAAQVGDALATLEGIVRTAHANYSSAVAANRQMWSL